MERTHHDRPGPHFYEPARLRRRRLVFGALAFVVFILLIGAQPAKSAVFAFTVGLITG
ncbi:MAG: hypothetical protein ACR2RB_11605 [Gammaproteobacteria bacterium]